MADLRIRKRHRLRGKEIKAISEEIEARTGAPVFGPNDTVDRAESSEFDIIYVGGKAMAILYQGKAFLSVRGYHKYPAQRGHVTVDMGAVPFVTKGADVMAPGIVEADPNIQQGDIVWVRDVKNKVPLAVGEALISGPEMASKAPGKAIRTILFVGDKLWKSDED